MELPSTTPYCASAWPAQRLTIHKPQAQILHAHCRIPFAELDASVRGWINHVRFADTWGLREHVFANHPIRGGA